MIRRDNCSLRIERQRLKKVVFEAGTEHNFFERGSTLARLADRGETLPEECKASFEDPAELPRQLTASRRACSKPLKTISNHG